MNSNKKSMSQKKPAGSSIYIPWHPAFIEALQLELEDYKDVLEFHPELQLTTEPLRIDCVVIKKTKVVEIKKNIGVIFRTWNLLEYKSPGDYVSISDFYKVYGYACIYTSLNEIPITDLTITFVESHYPRELIRHLKNVRGYTVAKTSSGIYTVSGDVLPIQIIDSRKLSADDSLWLRNLNNSLKYSEFEQISAKVAQQSKSTRISAYIYAIMHANFKKEIVEEKMAKRGSSEYKKLVEEGFERMFVAVGVWEKFMATVEEKVDQKWTNVIADRDAKLADKDAEIASAMAENKRLRAELEAITTHGV